MGVAVWGAALQLVVMELQHGWIYRPSWLRWWTAYLVEAGPCTLRCFRMCGDSLDSLNACVSQASLVSLAPFQSYELPTVPAICRGTNGALAAQVNVNVNTLLAISELDLDNSGEPGPQAKGVNHLETPLRQLHVTDRSSSCAKRGGHVQLCLKPRGARGIKPETFQEGVSFYLVLRPLDHVLCHWLLGSNLGLFKLGIYMDNLISMDRTA